MFFLFMSLYELEQFDLAIMLRNLNAVKYDLLSILADLQCHFGFPAR